MNIISFYFHPGNSLGNKPSKNARVRNSSIYSLANSAAYDPVIPAFIIYNSMSKADTELILEISILLKITGK